MCHGAQGMGTSSSPNLAGQLPEDIIKQSLNFEHGARQPALMQNMARGLTQQSIEELAAYFAYLPKARTAPTMYDQSLPSLVSVVSVVEPRRIIATLISYQRSVDHKFGAPWIEGIRIAQLER